MLKTNIPAEEFFNVYVATIKELYTDSFIKQNHLEPSNLTSFKKAMSRKAGVSLEARDEKAYTPKDLENIVNDTNSKYEEYANGNYTQELRKKGEGRYVLFSNLFSAVLVRLGYPEIAEKLKYTDEKSKADKPAPKTDEEVLNSALADAKATAGITETEEDKELNSKIELLKACEEKVNQKIDEGDAKVLGEVFEKLDDTIKNAKAYNETAKDSQLGELITRLEAQSDKIGTIIFGDKSVSDADIEKLKAHFNGEDEEEDTMKKENPFEKKSSGVDIEALIPEVLQAIPKFLQQGHDAAKENSELRAKIKKLEDENNDLIVKLEEAGKAAALPTDEDELVKLAKEVVNKIEDKGKLKDIGMVIMMKAL